MRTIDSFTLDRFSRQGATLCTCWRITRRDGVEIGLTDLDRDVRFAGTTFLSGGAEATVLESTADLAPDDADILGAFDNARLDVDALRRGAYAEAQVEIWRVDFEAPDARLLLRAGSLGEVTERDGGFVAEFRSLKQTLAGTFGRQYGRTCDAVLGDGRCTVDLSQPAHTRRALIVQSSTDTLWTDLADPIGMSFTPGRVGVLSGELNGHSASVRAARQSDSGLILDLWQALPMALTPGTVVNVINACDKHLETCQERFANAVNFRGFPFIPGNDVLVHSFVAPGGDQ